MKLKGQGTQAKKGLISVITESGIEKAVQY
jgi:hypothetical protein